MVFRDFAQGAFRLRQIGHGQKLTLFVIPEVMQLIGSHVARCRRQSVADYSRAFSALPPHDQWAQMLKDVVAWLLINTILLERAQFKLLCEQNLSSVWRKHAYKNLLSGWERLLPPTATHARMQASPAAYDHGGSDDSPEVLKLSVGVFREGVDFSVENAVPAYSDFVQQLTQRAADNHELCREPSMAVSHVLRSSPLPTLGRRRRKRRRPPRPSGCRSGRWRLCCLRIRRRTTAISRLWRATWCG